MKVKLVRKKHTFAFQQTAIIIIMRAAIYRLRSKLQPRLCYPLTVFRTMLSFNNTSDHKFFSVITLYSNQQTITA